MNQLSFVGTYRTSPCILTEGAVVERLRREFHIPLDEDLIHAALIYNDSYREVLAGIYKQYIDIATRHQLPLMLIQKEYPVRFTATGIYCGTTLPFFRNFAVQLLLPSILVVWPVAGAMLMMDAIISRWKKQHNFIILLFVPWLRQAPTICLQALCLNSPRPLVWPMQWQQPDYPISSAL